MSESQNQSLSGVNNNQRICSLIQELGHNETYKQLNREMGELAAYKHFITAAAFSAIGNQDNGIASTHKLYAALKDAMSSRHAPSVEQIKNDLIKSTPTIIVWMESFHTTSHAERLLEVVNGLQNAGLHVIMLTSEDTINTLTGHGKQSLDGFGFNPKTEFVILPSQITFEGLKPGFTSQEVENYYPYVHMEHPEIRKRRKAKIDELANKIGEFPCVTHIVTEMWPVSMCVFTDEITYLKQRIKTDAPDALMVSIIRDIPFYDSTRFNNLENELHLLETECDKILVRGDSGSLEQFFPPRRLQALSERMTVVGHFIFPGVPARDARISDKERTVLVSGVGSFNDETDPQKNPDLQFYLGIIRAKKFTALNNRVWLVLVSDKCPEPFYALIQKEAAHDPGIVLRRKLPILEHRKQVANCALFITITGYSSVLAGIAAGVPTVSVPTEVFAYGDPEGINDRQVRSIRYDALRQDETDPQSARPAWLLPVDFLGNPEKVAHVIDNAYLRHNPSLSKSFNFDGAKNARDSILNDFILRPNHKPANAS